MAEARVRSTYDRLAPVYDQLWHIYLRRTLQFLHTWTHLAPTARVLDIGCGTGVFAHRVLRAQPQQHIDGIDLSRGMLTIARQRCAPFPHVAWQVASMTALPFATMRFDVVVSASALHYVADPLGALREMHRVVHAAGSVTILDWCRDYRSVTLLDWLLKRIDPAHHHTYTQTELHQLLADAGFEIVRARRKRFGVVWGLMIVTARAR